MDIKCDKYISDGALTICYPEFMSLSPDAQTEILYNVLDAEGRALMAEHGLIPADDLDTTVEKTEYPNMAATKIDSFKELESYVKSVKKEDWNKYSINEYIRSEIIPNATKVQPGKGMERTVDLLLNFVPEAYKKLLFLVYQKNNTEEIFKEIIELLQETL